MKTILVIEDEEVVRISLLELLEMENYRVIEAPNGIIGYQVAIKEQPDLIICDVNMPQYSGFELLRDLRQNPDTATMAFIFLSAKADANDLRFGMELGADDYLTKP